MVDIFYIVYSLIWIAKVINYVCTNTNIKYKILKYNILKMDFTITIVKQQTTAGFLITSMIFT